MAAPAAGTAGITAFNNITGYTASGATGTTSTNLVFSTSPTITTGTYTGLREAKTAPSISSGTLTLDCSTGNVFAVSLMLTSRRFHLPMFLRAARLIA